MAKQPSQRSGKFIYAVIPSTSKRTYQLKGINKSSVYLISQGNVAAVVSDIFTPKVSNVIKLSII